MRACWPRGQGFEGLLLLEGEEQVLQEGALDHLLSKASPASQGDHSSGGGGFVKSNREQWGLGILGGCLKKEPHPVATTQSTTLKASPSSNVFVMRTFKILSCS